MTCLSLRCASSDKHDPSCADERCGVPHGQAACTREGGNIGHVARLGSSQTPEGIQSFPVQPLTAPVRSAGIEME